MDWLNDAASDYSVARRVLCGNTVLEPEMWMTLGAQMFPQFSHKGTTVEFAPPHPKAAEKPKEVENYEAATWRTKDMTLLEFLRKSNRDGAILKHIQIKHEQNLWQEVEKVLKRDNRQLKRLKQAFAEERKSRGGRGRLEPPLFEFLEANMEGFEGVAFTSMAEFAVGYRCQGEKAVAAMMHSRLNDLFYWEWLLLNAPFEKLEDFQQNAPDVMEKVPERYRNFALCMHYAANTWTDNDAIAADMRLEGHREAHIETVLAKIAAQRRIVERYLCGELSPEDVVPSSAASTEAGPPPTSKLTRSQKRLKRALRKNLRVALRASNAKNDAEVEECLKEAMEHKIIFAMGPPGTGKTYVVHQEINKWKQKGARVLFALPTGILASEMRAKQPDIDVDTTWGAFLFHRPLQEAAQILTQYDLVVVDEVSMLTDWQFEHLVALWQYAEQLPTLVLLGDFWQLPVVDPDSRRCELSPAWNKYVCTINFQEQVRCKSQALQKKLDVLRHSVPSQKQLDTMLKNHLAWKDARPKPWDIKTLFDKHPETTIATNTCQGSAFINETCAQLFFQHRHKKALGKVPLDYEANPENYETVNKRRTLRRRGRIEAADTEVYAGMRVFLTRNISKEDDFVNGMQAEIQAYDPRSKCLEVVTRTGRRLAIHPYTEQLEDNRKVTSYPVRLGYACTVQKVQGMTLPHITLWLDAPGCRAAAYVALSRVQRDEDYLIGGGVSRKHFVPAH